MREKHRTARGQAPGLGGTLVSKLERSVPTSLTPGSHSGEHPPARVSHGPLSQRVGFFSGPHRAPGGPEGLGPPHPDTQAKGSRGRKEAGGRAPRVSPGITGQPPRLGGALLTGFGTIRRKRKEGAGGGQEVKGALVLLSRGFVVKNWPQTLSPGTPGQALSTTPHCPSAPPTSQHS